MSETIDNPAKRLRSILAKAVADGGKGNVRQGWARVFGIEGDDPVVVIQFVGRMLQSVEEIKISLQAIPDLNYDLYSKSLNSILGAFSQLNLDGDWRQYKNRFSADALHGLEFASDVLDKHRAERGLDAEFITKVIQELETLYQEVKEAHLGSDIKVFLMMSVSAILTALRNYDVFGPAGIRDVVAKCYSDILLEKDTVQENLGKSKGLLDKFARTLERIKSVLVLIRNGKELVAPAVPLLTEFASK